MVEHSEGRSRAEMYSSCLLAPPATFDIEHEYHSQFGQGGDLIECSRKFGIMMLSLSSLSSLAARHTRPAVDERKWRQHGDGHRVPSTKSRCDSSSDGV